MSLLSQNEITEIINALIGSGLDITANRGALLQFINPHFVGVLPHASLPAAQLLTDLGKMNTVERLTNGEVPLQIYLQNAALLISGIEESEKIIRKALDQVAHRSSGSPRLDPAKIPETKERITHTDDMVTFSFMELGLKAGASVMKLRVPRFEKGQPRKLPNGSQMMYLGTGWLLGESLIMTNHHVVNARNEGEADASVADLNLQGTGTSVQFDFDGDSQVGSSTQSEALLGWNVDLDYAILRIPKSGRTALRRAAKSLVKGNDPIPVNIIQHPGGRSKRYGIRNNLVSASTDKELRYFTDTEGGSSGSPVFNDKWEVVALHRASTFVENVQFQGKPTAYVNLGTQLTAILENIKNAYPSIATEAGIQ